MNSSGGSRLSSAVHQKERASGRGTRLIIHSSATNDDGTWWRKSNDDVDPLKARRIPRGTREPGRTMFYRKNIIPPMLVAATLVRERVRSPRDFRCEHSASYIKATGHPRRSIIFAGTALGRATTRNQGENRTRGVPVNVIRGMHNQDSAGPKHTLVPWLPVLSRAPMILNYAGIAGRSVPQPRRYLLDRAKNPGYGSFQSGIPRSAIPATCLDP